MIEGPFPTEQLKEDGTENEIGRKLQDVGAEWGATTGTMELDDAQTTNARLTRSRSPEKMWLA